MRKSYLCGAAAVVTAAALAISPVCALAAAPVTAQDTPAAIYVSLAAEQELDKSYFNGPADSSVQVMQAVSRTPVLFSGIIETLDPEHKRMTVTGPDGNPSVIAGALDTAPILDATTGAALSFSDLKQAESVYVYTQPVMALSYPPQAAAVLVLAGIPADYAVPSYLEVDTVKTNESGSVTLGTDRAINVSLSADCEIVAFGTQESISAESLRPGQQLLVWHGPVMESYPAQTGATKIMVFPYAYEGYISLSGETLSLNGEALTLRTDAGLRVNGSTCLVPLRQVVEQLGFQVSWDGQTGSVSVSKQGVTLYSFVLGEETMQLADGEEYFPYSLFEENGVSYLALDDLLTLHKLKIETRF